MATVTGFTAARMLAMEGATIIDARLDGYDLVLITKDATEINVGDVRGAQGPIGPVGQVPEAPQNGTMYLRQDGLWAPRPKISDQPSVPDPVDTDVIEVEHADGSSGNVALGSLLGEGLPGRWEVLNEGEVIGHNTRILDIPIPNGDTQEFRAYRIRATAKAAGSMNSSDGDSMEFAIRYAPSLRQPDWKAGQIRQYNLGGGSAITQGYGTESDSSPNVTVGYMSSYGSRSSYDITITSSVGAWVHESESFDLINFVSDVWHARKTKGFCDDYEPLIHSFRFYAQSTGAQIRDMSWIVEGVKKTP